MAMSQFVAVKSAKLPRSSEWSRAATELGFDVEIEEADLAEHAGYLPVKFKGQDSGFEFYIDDPQAHEDSDVDLSKHKIVVEFVTFSDETEAQCAFVCALSLLACIEGIYFDSDGGHCEEVAILADQAREWIGS